MVDRWSWPRMSWSALVLPPLWIQRTEKVWRSTWGVTGREMLAAVRSGFHEALDGPGGVGEPLVQGEVVLEDGPQPFREGNHGGFGALPIGSALALHADRPLLPLDLLPGEAGELGDAEPGLEEPPNAETLPPGSGQRSGAGRLPRSRAVRACTGRSWAYYKLVYSSLSPRTAVVPIRLGMSHLSKEGDNVSLSVFQPTRNGLGKGSPRLWICRLVLIGLTPKTTMGSVRRWVGPTSPGP